MRADEEMRAKGAAQAQVAQDSQMQKMQEQEQQRKEMEEQKRVMVRHVLEPEALERLNRVGLVKPEKQQKLEAMILHLAQSGQLQEKMSDGGLIQLIEKLDASTSAAPSKVKFQRKRLDDDDDEIDLDNL
eukprot:CAMPEP_0117495194 /NCGR_PEP_ID=MMETSP0784-20121206/20006_1 /TAXON_ID=39447 /ORGANISM="" /LENGTH=129 /DNA_ID=CAMNT_0005290107 /DNA_START=92 /DNA_END=481 /DNA_ORIENTATION=-